MAYFKYPQYLIANDGSKFDALHEPGQLTPDSGIYCCMGCGHSVTAVKDKPLPPQNHHQHNNGKRIQWRLAVLSHWK